MAHAHNITLEIKTVGEAIRPPTVYGVKRRTEYQWRFRTKHMRVTYKVREGIATVHTLKMKDVDLEDIAVEVAQTLNVRVESYKILSVCGSINIGSPFYLHELPGWKLVNFSTCVGARINTTFENGDRVCITSNGNVIIWSRTFNDFDNTANKVLELIKGWDQPTCQHCA